MGTNVTSCMPGDFLRVFAWDGADGRPELSLPFDLVSLVTCSIWSEPILRGERLSALDGVL